MDDSAFLILIAQVIPITDAMKEPKKFPAVISAVMAGLLVLFGGAGALAYLTFGSDIKTVVLVNLDTSKPMVQAVCDLVIWLGVGPDSC